MPHLAAAQGTSDRGIQQSRHQANAPTIAHATSPDLPRAVAP